MFEKKAEDGGDDGTELATLLHPPATATTPHGRKDAAR